MIEYKVNIRTKLAEIRPESLQLNGKEYFFVRGWDIDDSDIYKGEVAMIPKDDTYPNDAPIWVASGDLVEVTEKQND